MINDHVNLLVRTYPGEDARFRHKLEWWFGHFTEVLIVGIVMLIVWAGKWTPSLIQRRDED